MSDLRDDSMGSNFSASTLVGTSAGTSAGESTSAGATSSIMNHADDSESANAARGESRFEGPSVAFVGTGWEMFKIYAVNLLLTIVTLGIYYVWGKTKLRRYVWGKSLIFREPLEYTGTGWEIFRSFLIVGSLFFAINLGGAFLTSGNLDAAVIFNLVVMVFIMLLAPYSIYCALRFRFSRTYWRGIRGRMGGSALRFAGKGLLLGLLMIVTMGLAYPFVYQRLAHYAVGQARFGSASFSFHNKAGALAKYYLPCWLASIVLFILMMMLAMQAELVLRNVEPVSVSSLDIGFFVCLLVVLVLWQLYPAAQLNWLLGGIRLTSEAGAGNELRVNSHVPLLGFLFVNLTNTLAVVLTFGLAWPWARARRLRYIASYLSIQGTLDWATISQSPEAPVEYGEGLFSVFDFDLGF